MAQTTVAGVRTSLTLLVQLATALSLTKFVCIMFAHGLCLCVRGICVCVALGMGGGVFNVGALGCVPVVPV